jgi:hypothetical protein
VRAEHRVGLSTVLFSGRRYVATADLGLGRPVPLMVHGNSRLFLSLTHAVAEQLIGRPVPRQDDYGYSVLGRGTIDVPLLRLGGATFGPIAASSVFDFIEPPAAEEPDAPVQGMLGTRFLVSAGAAVDFATDALLLGVPVADGPDAGLLGQGYRATPMTVGADERVTIDVHFPSLGRALAITPSTVADAVTLDRSVFEDSLPMANTLSRDRSPSGTTPAVFTSEDVEFEVAGLACRETARLVDLAEYGAVGPVQLGSHGMLGFDWMKQHRAILDYANRVLYVQP